MKGRVVGALVVSLVSFVSLGAQAPPRVDTAQPTFRAGTTLVEVSAIVTRDGVPVTDLRHDEVRVFDNGVEQPLVQFEYVDLTQVTGTAQRRDFVLVVDDLHILPQFTTQVRDVAAALMRALGPHDRLGLVTTGPHQVIVDPTTDRDALRTAIERLRGQQPYGATTSLELEFRARAAFDVIRSVADSLKGDASERRTMVLVSEGHQVLPDGVGRLNDDPAVLAMYLDVIRDAALANVAIYAIDPRGLIAPTPGMGAGGGIASAMAASMNGGAAASMARRRFGSLGTIAMHTGGTLTVDTNDLTADIPRIVRDGRQYYRVVYVQPEPAEGQDQPRTRAIEVKVERRGVEVRARQRYTPR